MVTRKDRAIFCATLLLSGVCAPGLLWAADQPRDPDEELLLEAKVGVDDKSLIQFLEKNSPTDLDPQNVTPLIRDLGAQSFEKREKATEDLQRLGLPALASLREALHQNDTEVIRRAKLCIEKIERDRSWRLHPAAVRLLVKRKPERAAGTLLRFLPYAVGQSLEEQIWYGLGALSLKEGQIHPSLLAALEDSSASRRALAGCIVGRLGNLEQKALVRMLLRDSNATVRLRSAQGLLASRDKAGIPVLVDLLSDPSTEIAWQAEELLVWVAGKNQAPFPIGAGTPKSKTRCRDAWKRWWTAGGHKVDMRDRDGTNVTPGLFLLFEPLSEGSRMGCIKICGCDATPRWESHSFRPSQVNYIEGGRLLVVEGSEVYLSELDLNGKILWQSRMNEVGLLLSSQRLPNGNTFIATAIAFRELNPLKETVYLYELTHDRYAIDCQRLEDGRIFWVTKDRISMELDPLTGREAKPVVYRFHEKCRYEPLGGGHLLVVSPEDGKLFETDENAKVLWEKLLPGLFFAKNLPSGGVIAALNLGGETCWVLKFDRNGRRVAERVFPGADIAVGTCLNLVSFGFEGTFWR